MEAQTNGGIHMEQAAMEQLVQQGPTTLALWTLFNLPSVKEGIDNTVKPLTQLGTMVGHTLINQYLMPADLVRYGLNFNAKKLKNELEFLDEDVKPKALEIPEEYRQEPDPRILKQTLNEVDAVFDEPMLKEMFANLLAKSMDKRTSNEVHPHYINVIKSLTSQQGYFLIELQKSEIPFVKIQAESLGTMRFLALIMSINIEIDNIYLLEALSLLSSTTPLRMVALHGFHAELPDEKSMKFYNETEEYYQKNYLELSLAPSESPKFIRGIASLSAFGHKFMNAVLPKSEATQPLETV